MWTIYSHENESKSNPHTSNPCSKTGLCPRNVMDIYQHSFRATIDDEGRTLFLWRTCLWNSMLMSLVFNRSRCRESGISLWNTIRSQRKSVSNNGAVCYAFTPTLRFYYEEFGMQAVKRAMQTEIVQNTSYH